MKVLYMFLPNKSGYGLPTFLQIESSKYSARSFWLGGAYFVSHWTKTKWNDFANRMMEELWRVYLLNMLFQSFGYCCRRVDVLARDLGEVHDYRSRVESQVIS